MAPPTLAEDIGANITTIRKAAGMQGGALAERLGVTQSAVSDWENGRKVPSVERLLRMAQIFDCPLLALLKGVGADTDAYRQGYDDGWRACADDVSEYLTWKPKGPSA